MRFYCFCHLEFHGSPVISSAFIRVRSFSEYLEANLTVSEEYCGQGNIIRYLEHVVVSLDVSFSRRGYLEGFVTSPSGTTSHILPYRPNDLLASDIKGWPILSLHFWGEKPQGTWRLRLQNHYPHYGFSGEVFTKRRSDGVIIIYSAFSMTLASAFVSCTEICTQRS